jgi:Domain of unknown function (DUF305)
LKLRLSPKMPALIFAAGFSIACSLDLCAQVAPSDEAPFLAENAAAMDKMMAGMTVKPTGDVDADFAAMMIPHHQGAIDMALAELRHGKNEQLRRMAQEIVVEQQQEIIAMRQALGQPLPPSAPAQTQATPSQSGVPAAHDHSSMSHGAMPMPSSVNK